MDINDRGEVTLVTIIYTVAGEITVAGPHKPCCICNSPK